MADRISQCSDDHFNIATKVQLSGILLKRPFGHQSNKWSKRFFIVKEGFLLYYPESEKKSFEKRGSFNIHPKGVIPLGGCTVEPVADYGQQYAIYIRSDDFNSGFVALAAENHYDREKWVQVLQEAGRITWKNTQLGEALIRELETQGLQLCKERQNYFDKLQEESMALRDEIDKNEELERVTAELDKEKKRLEQMMVELQDEHEHIRKEYEMTTNEVKNVEFDKIELQKTTQMLLDTLEELAVEKEKIMKVLHKRDEENCKLNQSKDELQFNLKMIEDETRMLLEEKTELEHRYVENEFRSKALEEDKRLISEQANHLQASLKDLKCQKDLTESELKEEIIARLEAEKRLQAAESSLNHLEKTIHLNSVNLSNRLKDEILPDVKKLKKFFEDIAEEARLDANKPLIMKNAVLARKLHAYKAKTLRIKATRQEKARSYGLLFENPRSDTKVRRSLSTIFSSREDVQNRLSSLYRTMSTHTNAQSKCKKDSLCEYSDYLKCNDLVQSNGIPEQGQN